MVGWRQAGVMGRRHPARLEGEDMTTDANPLGSALHAGGPYGPLADRLNLFGQFVGAWDLDWHGKDHAGNDITVPGELHVGWILGGRAVQDVWRVPVDPADAPGMRGFHGTTVRFYDPEIDGWRSTWIDPLNGRVLRFIGRPDDGGIVLLGIDDDPRERWSFRDIGPDGFLWTGETSRDNGRTWVQYEAMLARRRR
jgi:hypothetical protein